jgi:hypothetical protein
VIESGKGACQGQDFMDEKRKGKTVSLAALDHGQCDANEAQT